MAKRKTAMKGISRIDSGSTHGWFVRAYRNGDTYSKLFSDRKCGGKGEALAMAKEFRVELTERVQEFPKVRKAGKKMRRKQRKCPFCGQRLKS